MDPPDGAIPARLEVQSVPNPTATTLNEPIDGKLSYAAKIATSTHFLNPPTHQEKEAVIATHTTHNGMPTILFKASDNYGIMAAECRLTIVGRFL